MADINKLSNEEIRIQLQRFGYHVGPVTQYSRNVYIKRLQQLISEKEYKYTKSDVRTRLSTLSSEEDTDEAGTASSNRTGRKKRRSSHLPSSNIPHRNSRAAPNIKDPCIVNAFRVPVIRSARRSVLERGTGVRDRTEFRGRYADYPSGLESSDSDEAEVQSGVQSRKKILLSDGRTIHHSSTADIRRKLLPARSSPSRLLAAIRSVINPFGFLMTAFARRSRVSDNCIENNGFIPQPRFGNLERQGNRTLESFLTTEEERNWFSRNCQVVPKTLVLIVMLFFLGLAISYAALGRVKSFRSQTGNHYPICARSNPTNSLRCVQRAELQAATNLVKIVTPLIEEKSEQYACQLLYGEVVPEQTLLTNSTLLAYLRRKGYPYDKDDIKNMEVLILFNPHWGYTLNRTSGGEVLYIYTSRAPISCYVKYHLSWFVNRLIEAALCVTIIYVIFKLLSAYKAHAEAHKRNVRGMVARITKFLRAEFDNNAEEPFFVVIDYVRDQLIPPEDYKRMAFIWTSAVNFIRHNDPRIKEEQCVVNGELKTVWRWLPESGNASSEQTHEFGNSSRGRHSILSDETFSGSSGGDIVSQEKLCRSNNHRSSKIWQGQAFETMAGSPNSVPCSPTPCLKIRHMFDPDAEHGEDWPTFIRDAILEKCEGVAILHLFVDKTSREGCVYVKCRTPEDAGRAYCALHGWWFGNSHLVTVKYLRIERYHERFPGAVNATAVLKPSNNQRLSLGD